MNTIKNVCLFIIMCVSITQAQDIQIQWAKTYDYGYSYKNIIDFAHDDGFVFSASYNKIVKIDKQGIIQEDWPQDPVPNNQYTRYIQKCNEGYIITGSDYQVEYEDRIMLKKLDNQGRQVWVKFHYNSGHENHGRFVKQTHDNGYILFYTSFSYADPPASGPPDYWIMKTDPNGEKEWDYEITCGEDEDIEAIHQTSDGGFIVAYNNGNGYLLRLTADGQKIWQKKHKNISYALPTKDGGYIICGNNYSNDYPLRDAAYLKKLDENGDEIWEKIFKGDTKYAFLKNISKLDNNSYLLCGQMRYSDWNSSISWLIKTDSLGNKIWEKTLTEIDVVKQTLKISNNEFLLFGDKDHYTTIIKINENTQQDPSSIVLLDPVFYKLGVGTQPCLDWTSIANATSYLVEISENIDMSAPVISKTVSNSSNCIIDSLSYSTQYYWRVKAQFPDGSGQWSGISTFTTMPPPHIAFNDKEYNMSYVDVGDQYYTDREYTITELPEPLKNCLWIKTKNSDKYLTDDDYIQFQLKRDATIYIAYDNRASAVPHWLLSGFEQTEYTIQSSDDESTFNIWKDRFPAGDVTLGANSATGAEDVQTNYVVFIDIPLQMLDPRDNKSGIGYNLYFSWEEIGNFGNYDLQISDSQDMSSPLHNITNINESRYLLKGLDFNKDYYWRIKAHNRNDVDAWYQTQKFHTMAKPPVSISFWSNDFASLSWLEEKDQYYIDRNDIVLSIPDQLKNLLWIKTANNDADKDNIRNTDIYFENDATLYVGFDKRATSLPNWVTDDFKNTGLTITVSDSANELNIWTRNVDKGHIELGSNMAEGAENIKSHYVVLIDPNQVPPLSANFGSDVTSGVQPLTVNFSDHSQGFITSWVWDFGDGATSSEQNPSHTYENTGSYTVSLTVSGPDTFDTIIKENYITVKNVIANFSADVTMGKAPLTVSFTDSSLGEIDSWLWKFGDGLTSTAQNPSHVYTSGDSFTVTLFVRNSNGSNTMVKTNYIIVDHPTSIDDMAEIPKKFDLLPNYPNPFNPQTTIRFAVPKKSFVKISIYDINGKLVSNLFSGIKSPGNYAITWNASGFPSGMYFIKMDTDTYSSVRKCILVK